MTNLVEKINRINYSLSFVLLKINNKKSIDNKLKIKLLPNYYCLFQIIIILNKIYQVDLKSCLINSIGKSLNNTLQIV